MWEKYLARYVTPQRLEAYFAAHRRDFDGTEMAVSHILLRPSAAAAGKAATEELVSSGGSHPPRHPLRQAGVRRRRPKVFGRSQRQGRRPARLDRPSRPDGRVVLAGGLRAGGGRSEPAGQNALRGHLIRCDQIKPGSRQLAEVRKDLEDALASELLDKLATLQRRHTPVKYETVLPHFRPGTHELE